MSQSSEIEQLSRQRDAARAALVKIIEAPLTIAAPPDVVSAVEDLHELIVEIAREGLRA
jgi:hypothetical protein